jgi:cation:H+ antiporter
MFPAIAAIIAGLALLVWSADRFVDGAAATARHFRMPALLIGMLVVGFGTSAPEMVVSAISASHGNPGLALGNAYGSNITNIALILGLTALLAPIAVHSQILRKELPLLLAVTAVAAWQLWDGGLSRWDAGVLLTLFAAIMGWSIVQAVRGQSDPLGVQVELELASHPLPLNRALTWLAVGLLLLVVSSQLLVWGAVKIAVLLGVSDLVIGLTVVAVGTSLPELASSLMAIRKGEHDIALGNILGSNLFNTLAVVGIAGAIHPMSVDDAVMARDIPVMAGLTFALLVFCYGFRGPGRVNRFEGALLLTVYLSYTSWLVTSTFAS